MKKLPRYQTGVALFVCLMILLVLSIMGISAMRMSLSQSQVASSSQLVTQAVQLRDTADKAAIADITNAALTGVFPEVGQAPVVRCYNLSEASKASAPSRTVAAANASCDGVDADSRGIATATVTISQQDASTKSASELQAQLAGLVNSVGVVPGGPAPEYLNVVTVATVNNVKSTSVQEAIYPHR